MSFNVYTTDFFNKELKKLSKKYPSIKNDFKALVDFLKDEPMQGQPLGKDCYKIRMGITSKGKGKSGGSRVIFCVKIVVESIFLLSIYDKGDKESIPFLFLCHLAANNTCITTSAKPLPPLRITTLVFPRWSFKLYFPIASGFIQPSASGSYPPGNRVSLNVIPRTAIFHCPAFGRYNVF